MPGQRKQFIIPQPSLDVDEGESDYDITKFPWFSSLKRGDRRSLLTLAETMGKDADSGVFLSAGRVKKGHRILRTRKSSATNARDLVTPGVNLLKVDEGSARCGSSEESGASVSDPFGSVNLRVHRSSDSNSDEGESLEEWSSIDIEDCFIPGTSEDELLSGSDNSTSAFVDALAHRLLREFRRLIFPQRMDERGPHVTSPGAHGGTPQTADELSPQPSRQGTFHQAHSGRNGNSGKRNLGHDSDDEGSEKPPPKKQRAKNSNPGRANRQLACLFWKLDPSTHRECFKLTLKDTSRLKQHLNRKHAPEYYCERCLIVLPNEEAHREHIKPTVMACLPRTSSFPGITYQQRGQLSKKSDPRQSEIQRWYSMWKIVFPDQPPPASPYIDPELSEDMCRFMEFAQDQGPVIMATELMAALSQENGQNATPTSHVDSTATLQQAASRSLSLIFEEWLAKRESTREFVATDPSESFTSEFQLPVFSTDQPGSSSVSSQAQVTPTSFAPLLDSAMRTPGTVLSQEAWFSETFPFPQAGILTSEVQISGGGDVPQGWGVEQDWSFLGASFSASQVMNTAASNGTAGFDMVGFEDGVDPVCDNIQGGEDARDSVRHSGI